MMRFAIVVLSVGIWTVGLGCGVEPAVYDGDYEGNAYGTGKEDSSAVAVFLDFEFDGKLTTSSCFNPSSAVDEQLLYTVGQLNGDNSVGRLDRLKVTNVEATEVSGRCEISYSARLPVAWGRRNNIPENYTFILPSDVSHEATERFMENYQGSCLDWSAHDVTPGILWYYYRPERNACIIDDGDVYRVQATVSASDIQTTGKYPEYHKVWEDDEFHVVAIFGKVKDGGNDFDGGVRAYNGFVESLKDLLPVDSLTSIPMNVSDTPGTAVPKVKVQAELGDGRSITVSVFLIDSIASATSDFWNEYETLTPNADFIVYNGHSGLGANIRKLARRGVWAEGQYTIVFMNGCDTYAYVDSALADAHAAVNPDDPDGSKYVDVVANAMPSFFRSMPEATMAILEGLLDWRSPITYEAMFENVDPKEVVLVTGEHDNVYVPGYEDNGTN